MFSHTNIAELRKKHRMTQADLAEKLAISRPTLIAMESGERPLKNNEAEKIQDIFTKLSELEGNPALDMRISIPQKNIEKFKQILLYILGKVGAKPNIGLTALYKLIYFIDFDYYEKYEEQIMGLTYIKNHHGPTPNEFTKVVADMKKAGLIEEVKSKYFDFEQKKFLPLVSPDLGDMTAREVKLIDEVLERLSDKSAKELSEYSHRDVPWLSHEMGETIDYERVFYRNDPYSVSTLTDEL